MSGYTIRTPDTVFSTLVQDGQPDGSIDPQDERDALAAAMSVMPSVKTVSYILTLADAWTCIEFNNSTNPVTLSVPTDASIAFQVGTVIGWCVLGTGVLTISAATPGTTNVRNPSSNTARAANSSGLLRKRAANDWVLSGDLT